MRCKPWIWIFLVAALRASGFAQIATTQIVDTIHHADGTTATGTALISWSAFTTINGDHIPAGNTSAVIGAGGALTLQLVPNSGAIPIGTYYIATYHLDDNSVTSEYWVVPQSAMPVRAAVVESAVTSTSVAIQAVAKSYIDAAIAGRGTTPGATQPFSAPGLVSNVTNYNYINNQHRFAANDHTCVQYSLPGENGESSSDCIGIAQDDLWYPGWNYGSPGTLSNAGWFGHATLDMGHVRSYGAGIKSLISSDPVFEAPGDVNMINIFAHLKPGLIAGSDEGFNGTRLGYIEEDNYFGTIQTGRGGAGATVIHTTCTHNCESISLNTAILDASTELAGQTLSGLTNAPSPAPFGVYQATASFTVPVSTVGTLAQDVDSPRVIGNTTEALGKNTRTFNINSATDPTGKLISIMGPAFYETIRPASVVSAGTGVWTITADLYYSHANGTAICVGGAAGSYVEAHDLQQGFYRMVDNVYCSPAANTVWVGHQVPNGFASVAAMANFGAPINVSYFLGAEAVGVVDPVAGYANGEYFALMPNAAPWADGDLVEDTNNPSATYSGNRMQMLIKNPLAEVLMNNYTFDGLGGATAVTSGPILNYAINSNAASAYRGVTGGSNLYYAPTFAQLKGPWQSGIDFQYAPLEEGSSCGMLCVNSGMVPGSTQQAVHIFDELDDGAFFRYNYGAPAKYFDFNYGVHVGGFLHVDTDAAIAHALTIGGNTSTFGSIDVRKHGSGSGDILARFAGHVGNSVGGLNTQVRIGDTSNLGAETDRAYVALRDNGTGQNGLELGQFNPDGPVVPAFYVSPFVNGAGNNVSIRNGSTNCGKLVCLGPAVTVDTNNIAAPLYQGPAAAPTGACTVTGWAFSQDGRISYCNGSTWIQKL